MQSNITVCKNTISQISVIGIILKYSSYVNLPADVYIFLANCLLDNKSK